MLAASMRNMNLYEELILHFGSKHGLHQDTIKSDREQYWCGWAVQA